MNQYLWRYNFAATVVDNAVSIKGKLAVKTKETDWLHTLERVVIPISIHSSFHEGLAGDLKMNALISTIRKHVNGPVSILMTDRAHLQTVALRYKQDVQGALRVCIEDARRLEERFKAYFVECEVLYWHDYICQDITYDDSLKLMRTLFQNDMKFKELMHADAESTYIPSRELDFPNKQLFVDKAIEDLLEQCASMLVLLAKGYRYYMYPGMPFASTEYVNALFGSPSNQLVHINMFIAIESKKKLAVHSNEPFEPLKKMVA